MKIERWSLHHVRVPYGRTVQWSHHVESGADFVLLRLQSQDGHAGVAEVTAKAPFNGVSVRSLTAALEDMFLPELARSDPGDPDAVAAVLGGIPENTAAKALVDNACWDLRASAGGRPLWQLWGGRGRVPVSWTVTRQAPEKMAREAAEMVSRCGFRTLKMKGGQGVTTDVEAVRAIRRAVGHGVRIYVDANWAYSVAETEGYASALADEGVLALEDPCALVPDGAFSDLQRRCPLPLLVDDPCASHDDARLFLERGARALSTTPSRIGLSECRLIAALASEHGCATVVGLFAESSLGALASLQLAACQSRSALDLPAESTFFLSLSDQLLKEPLAIADGEIALPSAASLAELVDWERVSALGGAPSR